VDQRARRRGPDRDRFYYYRGDQTKLDAKDWHCFTLSRFERHTGKWDMEKAPVYHIID